MVKVRLTEGKEVKHWDLSKDSVFEFGVIANVQKALQAVELDESDVFQVEGHIFVWQGDVLVCVGGDGSEVTLSPAGWDRAKALKGAKG